jgi:hypothetical protein
MAALPALARLRLDELRVGIARCVLPVLLVGLYWLYGWRPFQVHAELVVDDFLYVRHAHGFLDWLGGTSPTWLGPFDSLLLSKAPLYGLWLAFLNLLGVPLRIGDFLLLLAGPFLLRRAMRPALILKGWPFGLIVWLLVANPFFPGDYRPHREGLQIALANLCLIAAIGSTVRYASPLGTRLRWAAAAGFLFGLCYLNREESSWLVPALVVAAATQVLLALWSERPEKTSRLSSCLFSLRAPALVLLVEAAFYLMPVLVVCTLNLRSYGVFFTTFRRSSALTSLYQRLTSLEPATRQAYVPIARTTRMRAYQLSPTFERLRPFMEADDGDFWSASNAAHSVSNGRSPDEREIFTSTLEFCLLRSAERAGAQSASQIEDMFRAIDRELAAAVQAGLIVAGGHGPAILAGPRPGDAGRIVQAWGRGLGKLLRFEHVPMLWPTSVVASRAELDDLARLTSSSVGLYPRDSLHFASRATVFEWIKRAQRIVYPSLVLSWLILLVSRRKETFTVRPSGCGRMLWLVAIPAVGLATFSLAMAIVEVLGFKLLFTGSFNRMGFGPLSVFGSMVIVSLVSCLSTRAPQGLER